MEGTDPSCEIGSVPVFPIELRRGPADGARLLLVIPPPEVWEVADVPTVLVPTDVPGVMLQVPSGRIKVHRYRRTEDRSDDGVALLYLYDLTFP